MSADLRWEVADFLFQEAELLDSQRWEDWLALFDDDATYWVPARAGQTDGHHGDAVAAQSNGRAWAG